MAENCCSGAGRQGNTVSTCRIERGDSTYPTVLMDRLGGNAPCCLYALGDAKILQNRLLGLVCSTSCPGSIVIKTLDAIRALRDAGVVVIGGFHSPMERECLDILLRGAQPVALCAAKGLAGLRLGHETRRAVGNGRLLVVSPFDVSVRRTTATQAVQRNNLVAALAEAVWVPHATPSSKTWVTIRHALARGQSVLTFMDDENSELIHSGAIPLAVDAMVRAVSSKDDRASSS